MIADCASGGLAKLRDSPEPWERNLMPSSIAVTTKGRLLPGCDFQVRAPLSESSADVARVELERVAYRDEREGAVRVVGHKPGLDLGEETPRSRTLVPSPPVEREHGVGQDGDLEALLGLKPGAPEAPVVELSRHDALCHELGL